MPLTASIGTPSPLNGLSPLAVTFTGSATGGTGPYTYDWDWGDGTSHGTGASPAAHTYADDDTYTVTLTVTDAALATDTATFDYIVGPDGLFPDGMGPQLNDDGSFRAFTAAEVEAMGIETRGTRDGSHPTFRLSPDSNSAERSFFCVWQYKWAFLAYMLGAVRQYTNGSGDLAISRLIPQRMPEKPAFACVQVVEVRGAGSAGTDDADGVPEYSKAECRFLFEHVPYDLLTDTDPDKTDESTRYVEELPSVLETQYLTLPGGTMKFAVVPTVPANERPPVPYPVGFPVTSTNYALKLWRWPYESWGQGSALYTKVMGNPNASNSGYPGTINKTDFFGNKPGTLLLLGVEEEIKKDPLGDNLTWNLTFRFLRKPQGHNYLYFFQTNNSSGIASGWYFVSKDGAVYTITDPSHENKSMFNAREFKDLFDPNA